MPCPCLICASQFQSIQVAQESVAFCVFIIQQCAQFNRTFSNFLSILPTLPLASFVGGLSNQICHCTITIRNILRHHFVILLPFCETHFVLTFLCTYIANVAPNIPPVPTHGIASHPVCTTHTILATSATANAYGVIAAA